MKNLNFKKVLALVLSLMMVFSLCTVSFTANAEITSDDLGYYVISDTFYDNGYEDKANVVDTRNFDGKILYRVAPQKVVAQYFNIKNPNATNLSADNIAAVKTLSYYIANETGVDFEYRYQKDIDEATSDTAYFGGVVYMLDDATGEIIPVTIEGHKYITIPAGFKGYIIYDLSNTDNYGMNKAGTKTVVETIKEAAFSDLGVKVSSTKEMLTKAWYIGEVAVSSKNVTELADYLADAPVTFIFNQANNPGDIIQWCGRDPATQLFIDVVDGAANGTVVNYGGLDGKGLMYTINDIEKVTGRGITTSIYSEEIYNDTVGTGVPYDISNVEGFSYSITTDGYISTQFNLGEGVFCENCTIYYVGDDGSVEINRTDLTRNWSGTVYVIFPETKDTEKFISTGSNHSNLVHTWASWLAQNENKLSFGAWTATSSSAKAGDTVTLGNVGYIFDGAATKAHLEGLIAENAKKNVVFDNASSISAYKTNAGYTFTVVDKEDSAGGKAIAADCYNATSSYGKLITKTQVQTIQNPDKVNAIAYKLKVGRYGQDEADKYIKVRLYINGNEKKEFNFIDNKPILVNYDGTITEGTVTNPSENSAQRGINIPVGFDGTIILPMTDNSLAQIADSTGLVVDGTAGSFATYAASTKITTLRIDIRTAYYLKSGGNYLLDDYTLIYQDLDEYKTQLAAAYAKEFTDGMYKRSYSLNNASSAKNTNDTYVPRGMFANSGYQTDIHSDGENTSAFALKTTTEGTSARVSFTTVPGENQFGSAVDFSKATAFSYWISVPELPASSNYYSISGEFNGGAESANVKLTNCTAYAISDDGKTILTPNANNTTFKNLNGFTGRIYYIFDEKTTVSYKNSEGTTTYNSWEEWYNYSKNTEGNANPITNYSPWITRDFTAVHSDENPLVIYMDDLRLHFNDSMVAGVYAALDAAEEKEKADDGIVFSDATDITSKTFGEYSSLINYTGKHSSQGEGFFDVAVDNTTTSPLSSASMVFTRNATVHESGTKDLKVLGNAGLTTEQTLKKEAVVFWIKVQENESLKLPLDLSGNYRVKSSAMTYDTNTGTAKTFTNGVVTLSGFEGYVIIPLQNLAIQIASSTIADFETFVNEKSLNGIRIGLSKDYYPTVTKFWMGDFRYIDSLSQFFAQIGAKTKLGDANGDKSVDIRDSVRLKRYNADSKIELAFQNVDIDGNGLFEKASELVANRKQLLGADYTVEIDQSFVKRPEILIGMYHGEYGSWDTYYSNIIPEQEIVNTYVTTNINELADIKKTDDTAWWYLSKSFEGEYIFEKTDTDTGKDVFDYESTTLNEDWKTAIDAKVQQLKDLKVWNAVVGFHTEEILGEGKSTPMTNEQYRVLTQYLTETYNKRFFACLSAAEVSSATASTYEFTTDLGYDIYFYGKDTNENLLSALMTNTGNRTDVKYWLLPTAYTTVTAEGVLNHTDAEIAAEIAMYGELFETIPAAQRGGMMFYNWECFYNNDGGKMSSAGLETLIKDHNYTLTRDAFVALASKYVK